MYEKITEDIINGKRLTREDDVSFLVDGNLKELAKGADRIREKLCGSHVDLCSIINGRSGKCSENCKFCAQSAHHHTGAQEYPFLDIDTIVKEGMHNMENGVHRFSIVTAGRSLSGADFEQACAAYKRLREKCGALKLCASHGFLTKEQFVRLRESGVTRYHDNIETSRRFFPHICTTHTFDEKLACIRLAQEAGLSVCCGGIIGMGEDWQDRLDMAFTVAELGISSIPLNALTPITGTPLADRPVLTEDEIIRTVILFRYINPTADVRLAAGRTLLADNGRGAFFAGANATITGDMLTTSGNNTAQDKKMLVGSGFSVSRRDIDAGTI